MSEVMEESNVARPVHATRTEHQLHLSRVLPGFKATGWKNNKDIHLFYKKFNCFDLFVFEINSKLFSSFSNYFPDVHFKHASDKI